MTRPVRAYRQLIAELDRLDVAVYQTIAATSTPEIDQLLRSVSRAADYSKLWLSSAALLAMAGGERGRRAALAGLASDAVTAAVVNALLKPLGGRRRPDRATHGVPRERQVRMPITRSLPSGHAAAAFAFTAGVASEAPETAIVLSPLAALVAYARVHTGVHYPLDAVSGSIIGLVFAPLAVAAVRSRNGSGGRGVRRWVKNASRLSRS